MEGTPLSAYLMYCLVLTIPSLQTVNAAHEFRVCVRPVDEDLKDKVSVWLRFKSV